MHESGEMYLETIYLLSRKLTHLRSVDIAENMGYSKPSVSRAVGLLKQSGHILVDKDGYITLTESGRQFSENLYERHTMLTKLLVLLGVDQETAEIDACKIEHDISETSFQALLRYYEAMKDRDPADMP